MLAGTRGTSVDADQRTALADQIVLADPRGHLLMLIQTRLLILADVLADSDALMLMLICADVLSRGTC